MSLSPVVSSSGLAKDEVIWSENLSIRSWSYWIHGTRLKIDQYCSGNILSTRCFIIINVNALKLEIRVAIVSSSGVNTVFIGYYFPKLKYENIILYDLEFWFLVEFRIPSSHFSIIKMITIHIDGLLWIML